jgi:hypothetical protein
MCALALAAVESSWMPALDQADAEFGHDQGPGRARLALPCEDGSASNSTAVIGGPTTVAKTPTSVSAMWLRTSLAELRTRSWPGKLVRA